MTILISRRQMHSRSQFICLVYRCTVTQQLVPSNKSCTKLKTRNKSVSRSDVLRFDTRGMKALLLNSPWNRREWYCETLHISPCCLVVEALSLLSLIPPIIQPLFATKESTAVVPGHIRALAPGWQQVTMSLDFNPWQSAQCARRTSCLACDRVLSRSSNHSVVVSLALSHACDPYADHVTTPPSRTTRSLKSNTT